MIPVDHLVYAVPDLEAAVDILERRLGVRPTPGGRHEGEGTRNALVALGRDVYLEILAPDPAQAAPVDSRWMGVDAAGIPRLTTWAVKATALEQRVAEIRRAGVVLGTIRAGGRRLLDGSALAWRFTDPHVMVADGVVPFLIDWGTTPHPGRAAPSGVSLARLRAEHPAPARVAAQLRALGVALPLDEGPVPALIATLETPGGPVELR